MRTFHYTLRSILEAREMLRDTCHAELANAEQRQADEEKTLDTLVAHLNAVLAQGLAPGSVVDAEYLRQRAKHIHTLHMQRNRQTIRVQSAREEARERRERLHVAALELRKMEKHQERQAGEWRQNMRRAARRDEDDVCNGLTSRKRH